jgi:hypothetical protein
MQYTVYYSFNMNIPVTFTVESDKELTEKQIMEIVRKKPLECFPQFDSTMVTDEERAFYDSMDNRRKWKTLMEEQLSFDDIVEED